MTLKFTGCDEQALVEQFRTKGYASVDALLTDVQIAELSKELERHRSANVRNLLTTSGTVRALATSEPVDYLAKRLLGSSARAVKATLFDKTPETNWKVPPHQDVTIVVQDKIETPGYGPWTIKQGCQNVQPPSAILEQMVAFRFHLDDCSVTNGALKIWPGSHTHGRLGDAGVEKWVNSNAYDICPMNAGSLLIMHPLAIHASSAASNPHHRRVIHVDFAGCSLPNGLNWLEDAAAKV